MQIGKYIIILAIFLSFFSKGFAQKGSDFSTPLDVSEVIEEADAFYNRVICVRGIVTSLCKKEGCFINIISISGKGQSILVSGREQKFKFPKDCIGKIATVCGTFYKKVYPFSRMNHWKGHGWKAGVKNIPKFGLIFRLEADNYKLTPLEEKKVIEEAEIEPFEKEIIDLDKMEFEANGMGIGKKCLKANEKTQLHSTKKSRELIYVLEGEVIVNIRENEEKSKKLSKGEVIYIPPKTEHEVLNNTIKDACYIFIYAPKK